MSDTPCPNGNGPCVAQSKMLANAFHLLFVTRSRLDTYGDISRHDYFVSAEAF